MALRSGGERPSTERGPLTFRPTGQASGGRVGSHQPQSYGSGVAASLPTLPASTTFIGGRSMKHPKYGYCQLGD
jgi:hypothetical protein